MPDEIEDIKSLIKEAEIYRTQGLLEEAKEKYLQALESVKNNKRLSSRRTFVDAIKNKILLVEKDINEIEEADESPDLSREVQDLISRVFSFSENEDLASIEGAVALAKFGQYERALEEFERLLKEGIQIDGTKGVSDVSAHFNAIIKALKDSYNDIRNQSIQLMRYAKDLAQSYKKIQEEEELRDSLSRYVGRNLLEKLVNEKDGVFLQNERKEVTVLFADIRSFTSMSERMAAEDVVSMLNEYFTAMVDVIFRNNGILDKFVGDELMALFGLIPSDENTPYYSAVKTAIEMQEAVEKLMKVRGLLDKQTFEIGIGINTGDAIVGNVGSVNRMDYTVIGDCVNVSSRLQSVSKGGEIILGEKTYQNTKELFSIKKKGKIKLKNKAKPVKYYQAIK